MWILKPDRGWILTIVFATSGKGFSNWRFREHGDGDEDFDVD